MLVYMRLLNSNIKQHYNNGKRIYGWKINRHQTTKTLEENNGAQTARTSSISHFPSIDRIEKDILPSARVFPVAVEQKEPVILSFDEVPGPKSLKYLSTCRYYLSEIGTQITAAFLTLGLNISTFIYNRKPLRTLSTLFDEYGPVVRFVSPVGTDIVLLNHPEHIQKVFALEGDFPVRSTLESLDKYRMERRPHVYGGLFTVHGQEWVRQRTTLDGPANTLIVKQAEDVIELCDKFTKKIYNIRNYQDEIPKDLYKEVHKWAFDTMGLIVFSKKFTMLETDMVTSQCDVSWMYHSLENATEAILKCESGLHLWKLFPTPAWYNLVKYCDNLDSLIGKHVVEIEQEIADKQDKGMYPRSLTSALLLSDQNLQTEDMATIIMDMLLIGINTITTSISFLLYNLSKHQRVQKKLFKEIENVYGYGTVSDVVDVTKNTPYLQACIKETLRLVPPIPLLTRILPKNITLDRYNIPRGTLIIMSTQDASLKELNYDDATKYEPERWLRPDAKDYHAFASIPFGYGMRKCLGQNIAETLLTILTIRIIQKYKLEYHYGDVFATRNFITRPNKPLKLRFIDRL